MVFHSGLYIPVSSRIHPSQLDLVIIIPVLALTRTCEPWYAAFKMCWYKAIISFGRTFLQNKCFLVMSMFVLSCSVIQYCDETFDGAKVICRWLFSLFYSNSQVWLESLPSFP